MSKTIILMRHAEAEDAYFKADQDRELSAKGRIMAIEAGKHLKNSGLSIDAIRASSALRTTQTAHLVAEQLAFPMDKISPDERLYHIYPDYFLHYIQQTTDNQSVILFVIHNPTVSQTLQLLSGARYLSMSTAAMACLRFEVDSWKAIKEGQGKVNWFKEA
jgi:phosphohistidine phosphatase